MIVDATDLGMIAGLKRSVVEIRRGNKSVKICTLNLTLYRRTETDTHTEKSTDGETTRSRKRFSDKKKQQHQRGPGAPSGVLSCA